MSCHQRLLQHKNKNEQRSQKGGKRKKKHTRYPQTIEIRIWISNDTIANIEKNIAFLNNGNFSVPFED